MRGLGFVRAAAGAFLVAGAASDAGAQARGGRSAAILLELPASARALALGGAYTAIAGDEAAIFYNPAQLGTLGAPSVGLSVQSYIQSSTLGAFSAAMPLGAGHIAFGVQVLNYGSEDRFECDVAFPTCEHGVKTGTVSASDLVASVGYGYSLARVRVGGTIKYVQQSIADEAGGAPAFDLGAAMDVGFGASIGLSVQNLGGQLTLASESAALPRAIRLGVALPRQQVGRFELLATAEVAQWNEGGTVPAGGAEVMWLSANGIALAGRVGAQSLSGGVQASPLTFGGGISARHLAVDYAFQGFDVIGGPTHRVGIRWWR